MAASSTALAGLLLTLSTYSAGAQSQHLAPQEHHPTMGMWLIAAACTAAAVLVIIVFNSWRRSSLYDLPLIPGPIAHAHPVFGNLFEILRPDFHKVLLQWTNKYGGIFRARVLWWDGVVVTDPAALAAICGRGEGAMDKAAVIYGPVNQMCSPSAHPNLLTSPADAAWRTVRKAVAAAFSFQSIRKKYPVVRGCTETLISKLAVSAEAAQQEPSHLKGKQQEKGSGPAPITVDVDQAALRVTLDVIGLAGFGHDFRSIHQGGATTCAAPAPTNHLLRVLPRCFTEVMRRLVNPARVLSPGLYKTGPKGADSFAGFQREMKVLLRECLNRDAPPPADDMSIGAQLWRVYHTQEPAPPHVTKDTCPAGSPGYEETAGGLLPPEPKGLSSIAWRFSQLLASITGSPSTLTYEGSKGSAKPMLSAERILSEIGILFVEGFETTGHTISWTLLNVATVPGVQDRIAAELDSMGLLAHPPLSRIDPLLSGAKADTCGGPQFEFIPASTVPAPTSTSVTASQLAPAGPEDFSFPSLAAEQDRASPPQRSSAPDHAATRLQIIENIRLSQSAMYSMPDPDVSHAQSTPSDSAPEPVAAEGCSVDLSTRLTTASTVSSTCFTHSTLSQDMTTLVSSISGPKAGDTLDSVCAGDDQGPKQHVHSTGSSTKTFSGQPPSASSWPLPRSVELEDLPRLRYLSACIKEAMRMLPVVSVMGRVNGDKPTRVGPYVLPPRTPVAIPLYCIQNSEHNWDRASEYLPERWLQVPVETYVTGPLGSAPVSAARKRTEDGEETLLTATGADLSGTPPTAAAATTSLHQEAGTVIAPAPSGLGTCAQTEKTTSATATATAVQGAGVTAATTATATAARKTTRHLSLEPATAQAAAAAAASVAASSAGAVDAPTSGAEGVPRKPTRHLSLDPDLAAAAWRSAGSTSSGSGIAFMPFSEGPRNCVGQTLAKIEVATVLASLLGAFRVELAPEAGGREGISARESTHLTLQTAGTQGIRMRLYPRWL